MGTRYGLQMSDDNDNPGIDDLRQKARDRMQHLRLKRKTQIANREQLAVTNLQHGERVLKLACIDDEDTLIELLRSRMDMGGIALGQNVYKSEVKQEAHAIYEHEYVQSSEEIRHENPSRQRAGPNEDFPHQYTSLPSTLTQTSSGEVNHQVRLPCRSQSLDGIFRRSATRHGKLIQPPSDSTDTPIDCSKFKRSQHPPLLDSLQHSLAFVLTFSRRGCRGSSGNSGGPSSKSMFDCTVTIPKGEGPLRFYREVSTHTSFKSHYITFRHHTHHCRHY